MKIIIDGMIVKNPEIVLVESSNIGRQEGIECYETKIMITCDNDKDFVDAHCYTTILIENNENLFTNIDTILQTYSKSLIVFTQNKAIQIVMNLDYENNFKLSKVL